MAATVPSSSPTRIGCFASKDVDPSPSATILQSSVLPPASPKLISVPRLHTVRAVSKAMLMADEGRSRHRDSRETSRQTTPNPAVNAINALLAGAGTTPSTNSDAPHPTTTLSEPLARVAKSIFIPESSVGENNTQTSPVSLSSFGTVDSTTAPTAPVTEVLAADAVASENTASVEPSDTQLRSPVATQMTGNGDGSPANRAFTFPGPVPNEQDVLSLTRGMSLPMPGYGRSSPKSPSNKRHKCPYCSTDFTRHHNLKSHLLTHSQEKPYECPTCQARFRRLHDLKRHTKLHTGERPHTCPKCGRRFARGDALARHNKGQGGCAGRRSSFGIEEDMVESKAGEDDMEGLIFQQDENVDEDKIAEDVASTGDRRRVSEPGHRSVSARQDTNKFSYQSHSSTYPPVGGRLLGSNVKAVYPPTPDHVSSGAVTSPRETLSNPSSKGAGSSISSVHFNPNQPSIFSHGGMTESPKPLSPGQTDQHHRLGMSEAASFHGSRSPNLTQQAQQQHFGRAGARVSSPAGLPPPITNSNPPQLPLLPGLGPSEMRAPVSSKSSGQQQNNRSAPPHALGPSMLSLVQGPNPPSNPGSLSSQSHGQSSSGSMREMWSGKEVEILDYVRELESRLSRLQDDYEHRMSRMQDEISSLRTQLQVQNR